MLANTQQIIPELARRGLEVNDAKFELIVMNSRSEADTTRISSQFRNVLPGVRVLQDQDQILLGAPLSLDAIPDTIRARTNALKRMGNDLPF